jgi:hypothetical protein
MAMWRLRINLSDDPVSRARLSEVLENQQISALQLTARPGAAGELDGEVVLQLPRDDALGDMLAALHTISPQVYVSRADEHELPAQTGESPEQLLITQR